MSPHYPIAHSYPTNPTTGIFRQEEPLDLSFKREGDFPPLPVEDEVINILEEKLQTLLSYYESLRRENSLLRAQESDLLGEIQGVREALLSASHEGRVVDCMVPDLEFRFAVSEGLKERTKRRQSSISTLSSNSSSSISSASSIYSSEEDSEPSPPKRGNELLVVKKKKKMEQNKLASRRFRERKKASWSQTVIEADRLGLINKELKVKANELELKIKWIKEALRKSNDNSSSQPPHHHPILIHPCNTN